MFSLIFSVFARDVLHLQGVVLVRRVYSIHALLGDSEGYYGRSVYSVLHKDITLIPYRPCAFSYVITVLFCDRKFPVLNGRGNMKRTEISNLFQAVLPLSLKNSQRVHAVTSTLTFLFPQGHRFSVQIKRFHAKPPY